MAKPPLSKPRILAALGVAIIADLVQFPLTAMEATVVLSVPGEAMDFVLDIFVMGLTSYLIGFHLMLLPTLLVELVPGVDMFPTWTGCVAFVIWRRKKEQQREPASAAGRDTIIDVEEIRSLDEKHRLE